MASAVSNRISADEVEHHCQVWLRRLPPLYRATRGPSIRATAQQFRREGLIESVTDMDTYLCGIELDRLDPDKLNEIMDGHAPRGSADIPKRRKPRSVRESLERSVRELRS
jgi:hypothetical protein